MGFGKLHLNFYIKVFLFTLFVDIFNVKEGIFVTWLFTIKIKLLKVKQDSVS